MSNTKNITPLTATISPVLADIVGHALANAEAASKAVHKAGQSGVAAFDAIKAEGIDFKHWARPGKDASPEHVADHAVLQRLAAIALANRLSVEPNTLLEYCYGDTCEDPKAKVSMGRSPYYAARDKRGWQSAIRDVFKPVKRYADQLVSEQIREVQSDLTAARKLAEHDAKTCEDAEAKVEAQEKAIAKVEGRLADATAKVKAEPTNAKARANQVKHSDTLATLRKGMPKLHAAFTEAKEADANMTEHVAALETKLADMTKAAGRKPRASKTWEAREADHMRKAIGHIKTTMDLPFDAVEALEHYRAILALMTA